MVPPTSKTIKSDAIHLLDLVSERHAAARFGLDQSRLDIVRRHTHRFLVAVLESGYDYWQRIPVLIDWNLGNFSVEFDNLDKADGRPILRCSAGGTTTGSASSRACSTSTSSRGCRRAPATRRASRTARTPCSNPGSGGSCDIYHRVVPADRGRGPVPEGDLPVLPVELRRARGRALLPPRHLAAPAPRRRRRPPPGARRPRPHTAADRTHLIS